MIRRPHQATFGAVPGAGGVGFQLWAPDARSVQVHVRRPDGHVAVSDLAPLAVPGAAATDSLPGASSESGLWKLWLPQTKAGDRYAFSIDGADPRPDPASRFQPDGVHGWSEIVDPSAFRWTDSAWTGLDPRRAIIYEIHVGTFTPAGTFHAAAAKLPYLKQLGITAIELMPLADFAGSRNWGYDGVDLFAPSRAYGRPDDVRAFVDAAHAAGLAVIVDVVYNHLGPEGAYLPAFSSRFLTSEHQTPWGGAVNLGSAIVRRFLCENALHWIHEYHADGLRLDATHALIDSRDRHFVAELAAAVHSAATPAPVVYAEDHRNLAAMVEEPAQGGWGLDGVWADDFHHVVRRMLGGDAHGYYVDYQGTAEELAATLGRGWLYTGQISAHESAPRGTDPTRVPMRKAVVCVQNHDQVGNRALGDRLHHTADPAAWRAAVTVLLTAPMTPLLFMGQEWATSAPFQFFTDFEPALGQKVVEGRRREFRAFPEFATPDAAERIPAPQAVDTFSASRLRWDELGEGVHARVLELHRALLALRHEYPALQASDACACTAEAVDDSTVAFRREDRDEMFLVVARLRGRGVVAVPGLGDDDYRAIFETERAPFVDEVRAPIADRAAGTIEFHRPGAIVFRRIRDGSARSS